MTRLLILAFLTVSILGALIFLKSLTPAAEFKLVEVTTNVIHSPSVSPIIPDLTLDKIFSKDKSFLSQFRSDELITIIATGDVIPARVVNVRATSLRDFTWPFLKTADFLKGADLTFINLETPLLSSCPITNEGMVFCGDIRHIEGLKLGGVDVVTLGNNHAGNWGEAGVRETKSNLEAEGIEVTGVDQFVVKEIKGVKFSFLGYNDITSPQPGVLDVDEEKIKADIQAAKQVSDVVIVSYHWGVEYRSAPDDRQLYLGHFTIDSGADLVIGNHPHWIQPVEFYKGKLITYAHGNFVFDQEWSQKTKEGVVGKYTFSKDKLIDVEYFPVEIKDWGQPDFLEGVRRDQLLNEMYQESLKLVGSDKI